MREPTVPIQPALRIGSWQVDVQGDVLQRDGAVVKLEPRLMRLLLALAQRAGQVVPVNILLAEVWADVVVTPESVYQAVGALRKALGDDHRHPTYIANVPRRGYRLVAPVSWASAADPVGEDRAGEPTSGRVAASSSADTEASRPAAPRPLPPGPTVPDSWAAALARRPSPRAPPWMLATALAVAGAVIVGHPPDLAPDAVDSVATSGAVPLPAALDTRAPAERMATILWVDDKPDNNLREREAMQSFGVRFELALSTADALQRLREARYDLVISDMRRPDDPQAGLALLSRLRESGDATRYVIYTSECDEAQSLEARSRGALACTTRISELLQVTLAALESRR